MTEYTRVHQEQKLIDIFVSVVDNYGDMGFLTELLISFENNFPNEYQFRIFTDNAYRVEEFLEHNRVLLPTYDVTTLAESNEIEYASIVFLLFHFVFPSKTTTQRHLILRIDYLSFDSEWIAHNGEEYISSTSHAPIFEVIPSLLSGGAGTLLPCVDRSITRKQFLEKFNLEAPLITKKWITLFVYDPTIQRCDFTHLSDDHVVFTFGVNEGGNRDNIISLPFLDIGTYHTLLSLSDLNIVRGEVSAVTAMRIGKPFLWDMYKEKGGFPVEMSEQFLDFFHFSNEYKVLHRDFNTSEVRLDFSEINDILSHEKVFSGLKDMSSTESLTVTLEKYIDRFYFSL